MLCKPSLGAFRIFSRHLHALLTKTILAFITEMSHLVRLSMITVSVTVAYQVADGFFMHRCGYSSCTTILSYSVLNHLVAEGWIETK